MVRQPVPGCRPGTTASVQKTSSDRLCFLWRSSIDAAASADEFSFVFARRGGNALAEAGTRIVKAAGHLRRTGLSATYPTRTTISQGV